MATIDIIGPLYPYTENDSRLFAEKMKALKPDEPLDLFIHSPGGSVWEGKAYFDLIMRHQGETTSHVIFAGSAASWVAMAANKMIVTDYSEFMIHSAMTFAGFEGNASQIDGFIDLLEKEKKELMAEDKVIAATYARRARMDVGQITQWMSETTSWRGKEILNAGFATEFRAIPARPRSNFANFDLGCYAKGNQSPWHEQFDPSIAPQDSWITATANAQNLPAEEPTAETPPATPDPEKLRSIARERAKARDRILNLRKKSTT